MKSLYESLLTPYEFLGISMKSSLFPWKNHTRRRRPQRELQRHLSLARAPRALHGFAAEKRSRVLWQKLAEPWRSDILDVELIFYHIIIHIDIDMYILSISIYIYTRSISISIFIHIYIYIHIV